MASVTTLRPLPDPGTSVTPSYRAGQGSPLVLLHGANMSWRIWRPVLPFLTGRHDVFAPTMPGHRGGPSLRAGVVPSMSAMVDVLCDQLDEAGIATAHLVGNSLGGWAAMELARRGRARSVVAISPAGAWRSGRDLQRLLFMFRMAHTAIGNGPLRALAANPALSRAWLSRVVEHPERIPAEELRGMVADAAGCELLTAIFGGTELRPLASFDVALCPVRIAWAEHDRTIPYRRFGAPMQDIVRGAEFVKLPGVGHVPMYDDPRGVARTVLEVTSVVDEMHAPTPTSRRRAGWRSAVGLRSA